MWHVITWGKGIFVRGQPCPHPMSSAAASPKFLGPLSTHIRLELLRPNFGQQCVKIGIFQEGQIQPLSNEQGPSLSNFWTSYIQAQSMTNRNQILHDNQIRQEESFYMVDHAPCHGQKFL